MNRRIVVVGGGLGGLSAAFWLLDWGRDSATRSVNVVVLEAQNRLGGAAVTERRDGLLLDAGADAIDGGSSHAAALLRDLGIEDEKLTTPERSRHVYVRRGGVLHTLPEGLIDALPRSIACLFATRLLSLSGKARLGLEMLVPRRAEPGDESAADFFRRRFGREVVDRLAEPTLGSRYAGDLDRLSVQAAAAHLRDFEQAHGSFLLSALADELRRRTTGRRGQGRDAVDGPPTRARAYSLLGGLGRLVASLAQQIARRGGEVRTGQSAATISRGSCDDMLVVKTTDGQAVEAHEVVVATPAWAASKLVEGLNPRLGALLEQQRYGSVATIVLAYPRADVPVALRAAELLIPRAEHRRSLGVAFTTNRWPGRAPSDVVLIRVAVGGSREPGVVAMADSTLTALARAELEILLGIRARPTLARVYRFDRAVAQPAVGYGQWREEVQRVANSEGRLHLVGAGLGSSTVAQSLRDAADLVAGYLTRNVGLSASEACAPVGRYGPGVAQTRATAYVENTHIGAATSPA